MTQRPYIGHNITIYIYIVILYVLPQTDANIIIIFAIIIIIVISWTLYISSSQRKRFQTIKQFKKPWNSRLLVV